MARKKMLNPGVTAIDATQFYKAIAEYAETGKKDFADALNRKTRDAFLMATKVAPRAAKARIRQKYYGAYPYFSKAVAKAKGGHVTAYTATVRERRPNGKLRVRTRTRKHIFSNAERTAYWKTVVRNALSHIGFVRAYLKACADNINMVCHFKGTKPSRLTLDKGFVCVVNPAKGTGEQQFLSAEARYGYRRRGGNPTIIDNILEESLGKGFAIVEADTREYIERKLAQNAKEHSA